MGIPSISSPDKCFGAVNWDGTAITTQIGTFTSTTAAGGTMNISVDNHGFKKGQVICATSTFWANLNMVVDSVIDANNFICVNTGSGNVPTPTAITLSRHSLRYARGVDSVVPSAQVGAPFINFTGEQPDTNFIAGLCIRVPSPSSAFGQLWDFASGAVPAIGNSYTRVLMTVAPNTATNFVHNMAAFTR